MRKVSILSFVLCFFGMLASSQAALVVTLEQPAIFAAGSGTQSVNLLGRSTSSDNLFSFTADVQLGNGAFTSPAGTFGLSGDIGSSNIATSSFFIRDTGNPRIASLSLDFNAPQLIPATATPFAALNINVNGLAPGNYSIAFLDVSAVSTTGPLTPSFTAGSFTITAVPEPSTTALVCVGCFIAASRARRRLAR